MASRGAVGPPVSIAVGPPSLLTKTITVHRSDTSVYLTWALMILWAGGPCVVLPNIVGGWGEASLQGQSTPTRVEPGGRFVPSVRACAQCYSCRIGDKMRVWSPSLFPFGRGGISLFPSEFVSWSLSELI